MDKKKVNNDSYYRYKREEMVKYIPLEAKRVLDVGCGSGNFGEALKVSKIVEVWGIERNPSAAEEAKSKIDKVIVEDIENDPIELPICYFDCIVFNDVLEHLMYPWTILRMMKKHVISGGTVVASIPNVRYWTNMKNLLLLKEWDYVEEGILDVTHFRFFTARSIEKMFVQCGYEVQKLEGINNSKCGWKYWLVNLMLVGSIDDMRFKQFACVARNI